VKHWILSDEIPPQEIEVDLFTWAEWFERHRDRVIRQTQIRRGEVEGPWVSTVFLGLDHNFGWAGPPLLYETMVFANAREWREPTEWMPDGHWTLGDDLDCERHSTWAEAMTGHEAMVERWGAKWWKEHGDQA
jgi:hypothetical protein